MNRLLCLGSRVGGTAGVSLAPCRAALTRSISHGCDVHLRR
jgi:hypothetical protein